MAGQGSKERFFESACTVGGVRGGGVQIIIVFGVGGVGSSDTEATAGVVAGCVGRGCACGRLKSGS